MELDEQTNLKLKAASTFLLQSPPGEINDCLDDIRNIILDDNLLEISILDTLEIYNFREFIVTNLNGENILITDAAKLIGRNGIKEKNRLLDPRSSTSFLFDHMKVSTSSPQSFPIDPETEKLRSELDHLLNPYVKNHYSDGVCSVYALVDEIYPEPEEVEEVADEVEEEQEKLEEEKEEEKMVVDTPILKATTAEVVGVSEEEEIVTEALPTAEVEAEPESIVVDEPEKEKVEEKEEEAAVVEEEPIIPEAKVPKVLKEPTIHPIQSRIFGLYLVGNKYNPTNFWTGRWKAFYKVNYHLNTLVGTVQINCHYYEQGNVQLATTLSSTTTFPSNATPTQILSLIKQMENKSQIKISEIYVNLAEDSFKGLRRALPKTRSKIDWEKISGYRLGGELGGGTKA